MSKNGRSSSNLASVAEEVITLLYAKKSAFKNALYTTATKKKLTNSETKQLFAICAEISKNRRILAKMEEMMVKDYCGVEDRKIIMEFEVAVRHVYLYELVVAKTTRKPKQHAVAKIVMRHRAALKEKFADELVKRAEETKSGNKKMNKEGDKSQGEQDDQTAQVFRYARINRLSTSMSTQKFLKKYFAKSNPSPTPDEQLLDLFKLPENLYSTIHEHQKSKSSEIIFQDKASCLPPLVLLHQLRIGEPCEIIDACSAPGNKTTGLAAKLSSMQVDHFVQLTACEIDKVRFEILNQNLVRCGALRVKAKNVDFFKYIEERQEEEEAKLKNTETTGQKVKKLPIKYCMLDPSCSGSGMMQKNVLDKDDRNEKDQQRIENLANFQFKLVSTAIEIPTVERIVYSTCSIYKEENEWLVQKVLNSHENWKLRDAHLTENLAGWAGKGISGNKEVDDFVIRLSPEKHNTQGFFVACFEKINK